MALVKINQTSLIESPIAEGFLTSDIASGTGTLTVANISGFAINQILIINPFSERSEIILTHASTAPTGSTITLASNTTQTHYSGEKVYVISYNQVEISTATTIAGVKSVLTTANLQPDKKELVYNDTASSTGYYFARFKNTITSAFSSYTDPMAVAGWPKNTVGYMIQRALRDLELEFSEKLTTEDCFEWLNSGIKIIQGKLKRWPEHYTYNAIIDTTTVGDSVVTMPTTIYDTETNKSILAIRVDTGKKLQYLDPVSFDDLDVADNGIPEIFTVRNSQIEIYPAPDTASQNVYCDYSHVATSVDSEGDEIDYQRYDMLQDYLTWRMKMKMRNNGELKMDDGYFLSYKEKLNDAIRTLPQNNIFKTRATLNNMRKK